MTEHVLTTHDTPFGTLTATWTPRGVSRLAFGGRRRAPGRTARRLGLREKVFAAALDRYFRSGAWSFDVPLDLSAGTEFDRAVWEALKRIPAGEVHTYGQVARAVGRPKASRAVGNACGRNPVPIVVPCHRVVARGGPGGFGLGLPLKRRLLELEGVHV